MVSGSGCDVNKSHSLGWTALHVAAMNDSVKYVKMFSSIKHKNITSICLVLVTLLISRSTVKTKMFCKFFQFLLIFVSCL